MATRTKTRPEPSMHVPCGETFPSVEEFDRHLETGCTGSGDVRIRRLEPVKPLGYNSPASPQLRRVPESAMDDRRTPNVPTESRQCGCGCGQTPKTSRSKFMPGHDRRMISLLAHAARRQENYRNPATGRMEDPLAIADGLFTEAGVAKLKAEIAKDPQESKKESPAPASEQVPSPQTTSA